MFDQEIPASEIKADSFPFPCEGADESRLGDSSAHP